MTWLQTTMPFGQDPLVIQETLYSASLAEARAGKINPEVALLTRHEAFKTSYLLLSPAAAKYAHYLPGEWVPVDPYDQGWGVLYSAGVTREDLGLDGEADA